MSVKGPKGELSQSVSPSMRIEQSNGTLTVERPSDRGEHRALHGLTRTLVANMVEGVTTGFEKRLEIQGVGYRARLQGKALEMTLGYSHPVSISPPDGIEFEVPQPTEVVVRGDRQAAGGRDRRPRAEEAAAGALQGQGRPLLGRVRATEGREAGMSVLTKRQRRARRRRRVRAKIRGTAQRPRLSVHRSNRGIFAQLIDDDAGRTVASVGWTEDELRGLDSMEQAKRAGATLAERAKAAGVETSVFDRSGYRYHGRVRALAEGAREGG